MLFVFFILYRSLFFIGQDKKMRSKYSSTIYFFKGMIILACIEWSHLSDVNEIFIACFFRDFSLSRKNSIFAFLNSSRDKSDPSCLIPLKAEEFIGFRIINDSFNAISWDNFCTFLKWTSHVASIKCNALLDF